jgi:hypothetical protein
VESVNAENEEDMLVTMCYIAECMTFNKPLDLEGFNIEYQRQKIISVFLTLLNFE